MEFETKGGPSQRVNYEMNYRRFSVSLIILLMVAVSISTAAAIVFASIEDDDPPGALLFALPGQTSRPGGPGAVEPGYNFGPSCPGQGVSFTLSFDPYLLNTNPCGGTTSTPGGPYSIRLTAQSSGTTSSSASSYVDNGRALLQSSGGFILESWEYL